MLDKSNSWIQKHRVEVRQVINKLDYTLAMEAGSLVWEDKYDTTYTICAAWPAEAWSYEGFGTFYVVTKLLDEQP